MRKDLIRAAQLLDRDVARTLGERHRKIVRFETSVVAILDRPDIDDVLVDHVQQEVHHTVNSTWPACPLHSKHPCGTKTVHGGARRTTCASLPSPNFPR